MLIKTDESLEDLSRLLIFLNADRGELLVRAAAHLTLGQARDLLQNRQGAIAAYQAVLALTPVTPSHEKARQFLNRPYDGKVPAG